MFITSRSSRTRTLGLATVIALMICGIFTFMMLLNLTPIEPNVNAVSIAAAIISILVLILIFLIGKEVAKILRSRRTGRAAARLHVRIVGLFCIVAAFPAILVAIVAGITLDLGLDRWFETQTKKIISSSVSIARAYQNESTRVLLGNTLSMAANLDRNRQLYVLDRQGFIRLFQLEARGRGLLSASIVNAEGEEIISSQVNTQKELPPVPEIALELATKGEPVPIPSGNTNLIAVVFKLQRIENTYLYTIVAIPPAVIDALRETKLNSETYQALETNRLPFQLTFALLYISVCLVVLLSAIWMGFSVANRIVTPIRRLMGAAGEVSEGNLDVNVDLTQSEGDLRFLGETFNEMVTDLRSQRTELVDAKELMDQRARFIEAVLSGVSAGVIGLDKDANITIANPMAEMLFSNGSQGSQDIISLSDVLPELYEVFQRAIETQKEQHREQITLLHEGRERTLNIQVTVEEDSEAIHSFVMTLDDITDLVAAQRNTAWADVARRIAHEIKNPLTPIQLSAERIRRRYGKQITDDREVFDNCTDTIIRQVEDIGRMVDEFSAFARMPSPEMAEGDLRNVLKETVFLQKVGFPNIEFSVDVGSEPLETVFDKRMISQALINVIKNAAEAIEAVPDEEVGQGKISVRTEKSDSKIILDIIDNGKGLPQANRQRLLEPYMTTREKGTGLGLAIVRKIAEDHGGHIELMDAPQVTEGKTGAMMRIILPIKLTAGAAEEIQNEDKVS